MQVQYQPKEVYSSYRKRLRAIMISAFVLRIITLVFILTIGTSFSEPYYISDDRSYERLADLYMNYADSIVDIDMFRNIGAIGYLEVFWPWVMCISAKLFGFLYAGRVINCILSVLCVRAVYDLTYEVSGDEDTSLKASKLIAYLPVFILTSCFPIKDIFLMYAILKVFLFMVKWHDDAYVTVGSFIYVIVLLFFINRTRGAILEFVLIALSIFAIHKYYAQRKYGALGLVTVCIIVAFFLLGNAISKAFYTKIDAYSGVVETGNLIKLIQMRNPWEVYKLPFSYLYATLQPMSLNYFSQGRVTLWNHIMNLLNITMYPVAIGNYLYIFMRKHSIVLWISSTALMAGISALSLGNSRHYLFLLPFTVLNYTLANKVGRKTYHQIVRIGAVGLFLLIMLYSFRG